MQLNVFAVENQMAALKMSQKILAEKAEMHPQSISAILKRGTCSPVTAGKIAQGLNISVSAITKEK